MHATLLALALLAAAKSQVPAKSKGAAPAPPPAALSIDATGAKASAKSLGLSQSFLDRVEKYAKNADMVSKGGSDSNMCNLIDEATSLGTDLHSALAEKHADAGAADALERALPGVRVALSQDRGGASYDGLARVAKPKHGSASSLLSGVGAMLDKGHPAFEVMKTAERGCTDYSKAQSAVDQIAANWKNAPSCVKDKLKQPIASAFGDDPLGTCWCQDQDNAAFAARHYASKLSTLKDFDGPARAKSILAEVDDGSAHFTCNAD